ncbi:bifunctional endoribonuclease/protein kinase ire1, partial [Massospora cicadina]
MVLVWRLPFATLVAKLLCCCLVARVGTDPVQGSRASLRIASAGEGTQLGYQRPPPTELVRLSKMRGVTMREASLIGAPKLAYTLTDLIMVTTVDGGIHGVDRLTGATMWSQFGLDAPLVKSYHGNLKGSPPNFDEALVDLDGIDAWDGTVQEGARPSEETLFLPEPGADGYLYILSTSDGSLEKFPLDIRTLVDRAPFRFQNRLYSADRVTNFVSLDASTGRLVGSFAPTSDLVPLTKASHFNAAAPQTIRLGFAEFRVRVHDELTGTLLWEFLVRDYVPDPGVRDLPVTDEGPAIPPAVPLEAFPTPVVSVFEVFREESFAPRMAGALVTRQIPVPKLTSPAGVDPPAAFVGVHNGSFYALTPQAFPYLKNSSFLAPLPLNLGTGARMVVPEGAKPNAQLFLTRLTLEPASSPPEERVAMRRWLWLAAVALFTLCGIKEISNRRTKAVPETRRKPKAKKAPRETLADGPQKARVLEDGTTIIGSIILLPEILGYGSHGTVVYRGRFQKREVAVKRMLLDLVAIAEHEVQALEDSDDHPYVIRYYCAERCDQFMYLALELCPTSLQGLIEGTHGLRCPILITPPTILYQIMRGVHHLHHLKLIHRDLKPQNILITRSRDRFGRVHGWRALISDFGLCKRLEAGQSSFHSSLVSGAAGTVGWRAPECLTAAEPTPEGPCAAGRKRITRAVDIFSAGCVFYYVLRHGQHPFGDGYLREGRILEGSFNIAALLSDPGIAYRHEAHDLIGRMLDPDPDRRPDSLTVLLHPYFWDANRKLAFLQDVSDQLESELRPWYRGAPLDLEAGAAAIIGENWLHRMDKRVLGDLTKFRGYDGTKLRDLMRAIRNKKHHYADLPTHVKRAYGPLPDRFLAYFLTRFPNLLLHAYGALARHPTLREDPIFRPYFELPPQLNESDGGKLRLGPGLVGCRKLTRTCPTVNRSPRGQSPELLA